MTTFILFFLLSFVLWGALIYKTWHMSDDDKAQLSARIETAKQQGSERIQSLAVRRSADATATQNLATSFRAWADQSADMPPDLHQWLTGLSDDHFLVITEFVAQFCADIGFELEHVVSGGYQDGLDEMLERVIIHIAQAMRLAFDVREPLLQHQPAPSMTASTADQLQQWMSNGFESVQQRFGRSTQPVDPKLNGNSAE